MMRSIFKALAISLFLFLSACGGGSSSSSHDLEYVHSEEGGTLYRTRGEGGAGRFDVIMLQGSWREMGRQYGLLARDRLHEFYDEAVDGYLLAPDGAGLTYAQLTEYANYGYNAQFPEVRELIDGMAETSGFTAEQQKVSAALMGILFEAGCSSMDAWDSYSRDGRVVVGRNWDTGKTVFRRFSEFLTVVVYNPSAGGYAAADLNYAGAISMQSGMNSKGVFIDLQNGEISDPTYRSVAPGGYYLFSFLLKYGSVAEVAEAFQQTPANMGLIINVADSASASVFEWSPSAGVRQRSGEGLLASSNHFIDPLWPSSIITGDRVPAGAQGAFSRERLANLLSLGGQAKGAMDVPRMQQVFDTLIPDGGPSFSDLTMYHIVGLPAERTLWLKAPGFSGWEQINLGPLFRE